jgi:hypothetical protein
LSHTAACDDGFTPAIVHLLSSPAGKMECNLAAQSVSLAVSIPPIRKRPHAKANKRSPVAGVGLMTWPF